MMGVLNSHCPAGWIQFDNENRFMNAENPDPLCYGVIAGAMTYADAERSCAAMLGSLASIKEENARKRLIGVLNGTTTLVYVGRFVDYTVELDADQTA